VGNVLLIGYDVEAGTSGDLVRETRGVDGKEITEQFLRRASDLHNSYGLPGTMFVVGKKVEDGANSFSPYVGSSVLEFQQHTYAHLALKPCVRDTNGKLGIIDWPTAKSNDEVRTQVRTANRVMEEKLGIRCTGLSAPFGYFMGFSDRPDILTVLRDEGIRYVRSFQLNKEVAALSEPFPLDFDAFTYEPQGFPDILEFCFKGYSDVGWALKYGWDSRDEYVNYLKHSIDVVERTSSVWGIVMHDWSLVQFDKNLSVLEDVLSYARRRAADLVSFGEARERLVSDPRLAVRKRNWRVVYGRATA
jgi:peptidoglycan/xylan/chitin deacetylase (PgdA/CDA1 family)